MRVVDDVRSRLIEVVGRASQDFGLGRITGQILVFAFLSRRECSLDDMVTELGVSKAAVSIAARQLEALGLLQRVWKKADRRRYYRTVDNFGAAVQKGILGLVRNKLASIDEVLRQAESDLQAIGSAEADADTRFLRKRVARGMRLRDRSARILNSPILTLLGR